MSIVAERRRAAGDAWGSFEGLVATWSELDVPEGYRAEVAQGAIRMNPAPAPRHAVVVSTIEEVLRRSAPGGLLVLQGVNVRFDASEALYIPDLVVCATTAIEAAEADDDRLYLAAADLAMAVEVTSPSNARTDRVEKRLTYGRGLVPAYLLVDRVRQRPTVTLHTDPIDGAYRRIVTVPFGDPIRLPAPFDVDLDTASFR